MNFGYLMILPAPALMLAIQLQTGPPNYGRMVNTRAIESGMTFRPLAVIAKDTLDWHRTRPAAQQDKLRVGISREREAELLRQWRAG